MGRGLGHPTGPQRGRMGRPWAIPGPVKACGTMIPRVFVVISCHALAPRIPHGAIMGASWGEPTATMARSWGEPTATMGAAWDRPQDGVGGDPKRRKPRLPAAQNGQISYPGTCESFATRPVSWAFEGPQSIIFEGIRCLWHGQRMSYPPISLHSRSDLVFAIPPLSAVSSNHRSGNAEATAGINPRQYRWTHRRGPLGEHQPARNIAGPLTGNQIPLAHSRDNRKRRKVSVHSWPVVPQ